MCKSFQGTTNHGSLILVHYDPASPIRMATDTSLHFGVGAVISHIFPNGDEKPILCLMYIMNYPAECNYAHKLWEFAWDPEILQYLYRIKI